MVIELNIENDATRESTSIPSFSSASESASSTYSSTAKSIRASPQSTLNAAITPMTVMNTLTVASVSHSQVYYSTGATSSLTTTTNTNNSNHRKKTARVNIMKHNKRRKKATYFTLTYSSHYIYLQKHLMDATNSYVSLSSIQCTALNHFETTKYKPSLEV